MNRVQHVALGLLLAQLLLAAFLWYAARAGSQGPEILPLLPGSVLQADGIHIADAEGQAVLKREADGRWMLPELHELPADGGQVAQLGGAMQALQTGWPVTTTRSAHERFEVSADKYQRRIQWFQGEQTLATLYVGTAPDFRQAHVRLDGDDEVYAVDLNSYELPADDGSWLDRDLLALKELQRIEGPDYRLSREGGGWRLHGLEANAPAETPNQQRVDELVEAIEGLRVLALHEEEEADSDSSGTPEPLILALRASGREWQYHFFRMGEEDYRVSRDDRPQVFTLSRADHERISDVNFAALLAAPEPAPTPEVHMPATEPGGAGGQPPQIIMTPVSPGATDDEPSPGAADEPPPQIIMTPAEPSPAAADDEASSGAMDEPSPEAVDEPSPGAADEPPPDASAP